MAHHPEHITVRLSAFGEVERDREIERLQNENENLRHALDRTRNVLNNMAMEHETGWRSIFARWPIHHEPLRSDARGLLPVVDAALAQRASRDEEAEELFQSERISAALATYDFVLGDIETNYEDREERIFDAMKAAIQRADHIARTGRTGER
ncbi:hypothetical protein LPC10_01925 [Methylorubrum sp. B1-46]|uniref:hypothetical protein n=1 Tax=Methylorubrum sp. B1-46 TaxID=2897334 RepID=UPI001E361961|nr:hypothetical protein [Methylorubrum sp. B1-46]UGB26399.1 hypothetical protein LPC10_01925 [Methylorubrum sp. B1-46]